MNALILVDLQIDFCPGGALEVAEGDAIIPIANALMPHFDCVVATQDWHPATHGSFAANHLWRKPGQVIDLDGLPQILWPMHCVQGSMGARFHRDLLVEKVDKIVQKGTEPNVDSYSAFFDNGKRKQTDLDAFLREKGVDSVFIMGLATDYCVKFTALDAVDLGYQTTLIVDACRGVNLTEGDVEHAVAEMRAAGVAVVSSRDVLTAESAVS